MSFFYRPLREILVFALCVVLALTVLAAQTHAREEVFGPQKSNTMTLQDVLQHTYTHNPSLQAARAEWRSVRELLPQAYSGWQPTVDGEAGITSTDVDGSNFGGGTGSTSKDLALSLNQPLFRGGRTLAETAAARHTIEARTALLRDTEQTILVEAVTAYMNVLRDQALLELSQETRDVIARQREATQDRFDVGELTRTDVSQAEARLAKAEADVTTARGNLNSGTATFYQIIGISPGVLQHPQMDVAIPPTLDEIIMQAENNSPVVIAAQRTHQASEEDVDGVFGELLPEVGLVSSWNKTFDPSPGLIDEQTSKAFGISASIPLYQAGGVRSRVREAKHKANQRFIEIVETKRQVRQAAVDKWSTLQAARAEIRSRQAQVEASKVAQEGVHYESELGSRTVLDALDADQELLDAQVALVTAKRNEIVTLSELLATIGSLTPRALGFDKDYTEELGRSSLKIFDMHVDSVAKLD